MRLIFELLRSLGVPGDNREKRNGMSVGGDKKKEPLGLLFIL
jgi:hypothetical protein